MFKISIIIPCYNAEMYIERCLNSIISQTIGYEHIQMILVNDASTDGTLELLQRYEQEFPNNICVITYEENKGQAYARNLALQYAMAEYVLNVDADDWIELDAVEKMIHVVEKQPVDMVMCYNDRPKYEVAAISLRLGEDEYYEFDDPQIRKEVIMSQRLRVMACGRMIRKELLIENQIEFPEGYKFEDCYWTMRIYLAMKNVYIINETLYHYYWNPESTVNGGKQDLDRVFVGMMLLEDAKRYGYYEQFKEEIDFYFYEKAFCDTIFALFRFNQVSIEMIELIKKNLLLNCEILNNYYYVEKREIKYSILDLVLRRLLTEEITRNVILEVADEINRILEGK